MQGRILAVDPGGRRVGLALSDPLRIIASPHETLLVEDDADAVRQIVEVIAENAVTEVVVGIPMRSEDEKSQQAQKVEAFIASLRKAVSQPVHTVDESYTSVEAEFTLHQMGKKVGQNKGAVDRIAASLILRHYLKTIQEI